MGHTTRESGKNDKKNTVCRRNKVQVCCVEPSGKDWVDQNKKSVKRVTHGSIRREFKPTGRCGDGRIWSDSKRKTPEDEKERVASQIT